MPIANGQTGFQPPTGDRERRAFFDLLRRLKVLEDLPGGGSGDADAHIADTVDAHDASAISFTPTGTISSTNVQAAILEAQAEAPPGPTGPTGATGPQGPMGPSGQAAGKIYYYAVTDASDITGYKTMHIVPSTMGEQTIATPCSGTSDVLVASFATDPGEPGAVTYPPGTAFRRLYAMVDRGTARLHLQVYIRNAAGTETLVRDEFSATFANQTVALQEWIATPPSAGTLLATDRIVNKIYAQRVTGTQPVTVTTFYEGSSHESHIQTTISVGAQGPQGEPGPAGPAGPEGPEGPEGPPGEADEVWIGPTDPGAGTPWEMWYDTDATPAPPLQEVFIGPSTPTDPNVELWVDEDEFPVALKAKIGGGWVGVGGAEEVTIGPDDPIATVPTTELWYDTDAPAGLSGVGIPSAGTTGQVLTKTTNTDYDVSWKPVLTPRGCVLSGNAQNIGSGSAVDVAWDTEIDDADGWHTGSSATLTVPAGPTRQYVISFIGSWSASVPAATAVLIINGAAVADCLPTAGIWLFAHVLTIVRTMPAGTTLKIAVYQATGSAKLIYSRLEIM